jgi:outer membrane biosynthesis protein TonB
MNTLTQEKKYTLTGYAGSIVAHIIFLLIAFFGIVWDKPDPPLPEYGVELNFGLDDAGYGDIQNLDAPGDNQAGADKSEPTPVVRQETPAPLPDPTPVTEQRVVMDENFGEEVKMPPQPKEEIKKPEPKPEPKIEAPTPKPEPTPAPQPKQETAPKPIDSKALYPGGSGTGTQTGGSNNNGDRPGAVGDQGNPKGSLDAKALYGNPGSGGGGGAALDMAGWRWDKKPKVDDQSTEQGRIVFEIKVDESGEIISVRTLEKTVSPSVEQIYRKEVEKLTFTPTSDNSAPAPISVGRITFIIRSK